MSRYELAEKAHIEEQTYYTAVDQTAKELAALDGKKEVVRISENDVYARVRGLVNHGPVSYGDKAASFIKGFYSDKGTWYSLTRQNH